MHSTVLSFALLPLVSSQLFATQKCCPDGHCYDLGPPWATLTRPAPPPTCTADPARYLLTTRSNPVYPYVFSNNNLSTIREYYNATKPTVLVFHGWTDSDASYLLRNITAVYLKRVDANAFYVDFGKVALNYNYPQVVSDIRVVATYVIEMVQTLINLGTLKSQIHLIGLSLGAHVASYVGKAIPDIGRITGLDPAGPMFTDQSCKVRLCKDDANFTEAIHTNGDAVFGFGTRNADAQVNFWVNGGWDQPKCWFAVKPVINLQAQNITDVVDLEFCSHNRSMFYYTEALASNCTFWGVRPNIFTLSTSRLTLGLAAKYVVRTQGCTLANCTPIGLDTINAAGRGDFIVPTNYNSPYCGNCLVCRSGISFLTGIPGSHLHRVIHTR